MTKLKIDIQSLLDITKCKQIVLYEKKNEGELDLTLPQI